MIKINFYRLGHANNSSSSHSLIFPKKMDEELMYNTETTDFGWSHFVCSSIEAKKNYILSCLKTSYKRCIDLTYAYCDDIKYSDVTEFIDICFKKWINKHFSEYEFDTDIDCYVDHQSEFIFPLHRNKQKGINKKLAKDIIKEFLSSKYVVLGGNDNVDESHPLSNVDKHKNHPFILFWKFCTDVQNMPKAEYDISTNEYVISNGGNIGSLMKIEFV